MKTQTIDKRLKKINDNIKSLSKKEMQLTRAGCLNAYLHIKKGTNKMYSYAPVDAAGKRQYTYIGVDPKKQQRARDALARYHQRQEVRNSIAELEVEYATLNASLDDLVSACATCEKRSTQRLAEFACAG